MKKQRIIMGALMLVFTIYLINAEITWDDSTTVVNTLGGNPCGGLGDSWNINPPIKYYTIPKGEEKLFDCRSPFPSPYNNSCCPSGFSCKEVGSGVFPLPGYAIDAREFTCLVSTERYCSDFLTEASCNTGATFMHAKNSIESRPGITPPYCGTTSAYPNPTGPGNCVKNITCNCIWNSVNGSCLAKDDIREVCNGVPTPPPSSRECYWKIIDDNGCNLGKELAHVIWQYVTGDGITNCGEYFEDDVNCGVAVKLTAFTIINVIAAILIIGIIYYFYLYKKKNSKSEPERVKKGKTNKKKKR